MMPGPPRRVRHRGDRALTARVGCGNETLIGVLADRTSRSPIVACAQIGCGWAMLPKMFQNGMLPGFRISWSPAPEVAPQGSIPAASRGASEPPLPPDLTAPLGAPSAGAFPGACLNAGTGALPGVSDRTRKDLAPAALRMTAETPLAMRFPVRCAARTEYASATARTARQCWMESSLGNPAAADAAGFLPRSAAHQD